MELGFEPRPSDGRAHALHHCARHFYHYLPGARPPYVLSVTLSLNGDAHSTDVGTDTGHQGPLSSTNRIWIWNLLLQISALPFLWMTPQKWSQRMFNGICWTGLIMICSQTLGSSWTHRPDGCMACFWRPQRHVLCRAQALASCWVPRPATSWGAVWASTSLTSLLLGFPTCKVGVVILFVEEDSQGGLCLHA